MMHGVRVIGSLLVASIFLSCSNERADWALVQQYLDAEGAVFDAMVEAREAAALSGERPDRDAEKALMASRPNAAAAIKAAEAILRQGASHERYIDAANFLVTTIPHDRPDAPDVTMVGLEALKSQGLAFEDWQNVIMRVSRRFLPGQHPRIDDFVESFDSHVPGDAWLSAFARNESARRRFHVAIDSNTSEADRKIHRDRGIELLAGIEEVSHVPALKSLNDEAAGILFTLEHLTPGGTLPPLSGARLDGSEDSFGTYKGKALLIDFWASWCGPCIDEIPPLTRLYEDLPRDRFEIISISDDRSLDDVHEFQAKYPMPWTNWFDGLGGPVSTAMGIYAFPTYIFVDAEGSVVAWRYSLDDEFLALIRGTVR